MKNLILILCFSLFYFGVSDAEQVYFRGYNWRLDATPTEIDTVKGDYYWVSDFDYAYHCYIGETPTYAWFFSANDTIYAEVVLRHGVHPQGSELWQHEINQLIREE